jgi:hypothetical protein
MLLKNARHEKLVMGSVGSSLVGKPSSSTSGGCVTQGVSGSAFDVSSRRNLMGGGAASSESDSGSGGSVFSGSSIPRREWARQKWKKLWQVSN